MSNEISSCSLPTRFNAELLIAFINDVDEDISGILSKVMDDTKLGG